MTFRSAHEFLDIRGGMVCQGVYLQVAPEHFHRIQLRSVRREEDDMNGTAAVTKFRRSRAMHFQPVPNNDDRRSQMTAKFPDKAKNVWSDNVFIREKRKVKSHPPSPRGYSDRGNDRDALAGSCPLIEHRGSPTGAQVRRASGAIRSPLSSRKTRAAFRRQAFFLPEASPFAPSPESPLRPALSPVAGAFGD